ncbi:MAG: VOC family protein [Gammaproteobacteria bacterium]|nr:VOC family protein [Rhodocyclaceae bacterium]MBU3910011.1 VOC family protein [Gammaproteobacteria bacterium]MBU3990688.1 VOC family protein [Gammaproteobacteria bacterium]MBU4003984.1 VOC family protein [Gammaproteobacteria bacterium]MBU4020231.1 VOC family protein [Gammaproteobacteria bacterium]
MPRSFIDHLVVTAPNLEVGAAYVRSTLGVAPQPGGEHARMGTHNLLLRLGDDLYLEVIATNPNAPVPARPRWFALDTLEQDAAAALTSWVVRTPDIQASAAACTERLGSIEPMSRGALDWRITIPADGLPPLHGLAPALIEWQTDGHPAARLADHGLSLAKFELFHAEPQRVSRLLTSLELEGPFAVSPLSAGHTPYLVAHINTPQGLRLLTVQHAAN